jgi:hypothetical protein
VEKADGEGIREEKPYHQGGLFRSSSVTCHIPSLTCTPVLIFVFVHQRSRSRKPHLRLPRAKRARAQGPSINRSPRRSCTRPLAASTAISAISLGYTFRIGGWREYLLQGTSFDLIKQPRRWRSTAYNVYWRKQTEILGPHLQAKPLLTTKLWEIIETADVMEYMVVSLVREHLLACTTMSPTLLPMGRAQLASSPVSKAPPNSGSLRTPSMMYCFYFVFIISYFRYTLCCPSP